MTSLAALKGRALRGANQALAALGVRLVRTTKHKTLIEFLNARRIDLIVDVGANKGQFGEAVREEGYSGRILSFEPIRDPFLALEATARRSGPWEVFNFGMSDCDGEADINVSRYNVFSSLNAATGIARDFHPDAEFVRTERIRLCTLDSLGPRLAGSRAFLKIDTQGHEEAVLRGATNTLKSFHGVQMEVPIQHLYEGVWDFEEAIAFMRERGFILSNLIPTNFSDGDDRVSLLEVDCVFRNQSLPHRA